jgi:hypothetical protein
VLTASLRNTQGYDKHHADIELLRLKNFTLGTRLSDDEVLGARALDRISGLVRAMVPFVSRVLFSSSTLPYVLVWFLSFSRPPAPPLLGLHCRRWDETRRRQTTRGELQKMMARRLVVS